MLLKTSVILHPYTTAAMVSGVGAQRMELFCLPSADGSLSTERWLYESGRVKYNGRVDVL